MKITVPYSLGQQVRVLPVKVPDCSPVRYYKPSVAVIVEVNHRGNGWFNYGIGHVSGNNRNSGWWFNHEVLELMLNGEITQKNLQKTIEYLGKECEKRINQIKRLAYGRLIAVIEGQKIL